jgi:hypothetical protein
MTVPQHSGGCVRPAGVAEESVLLPIASRPMGVPAIEDRRLLVRVRDVGAHLGEEVQGIEHAEACLVMRVDRV